MQCLKASKRPGCTTMGAASPSKNITQALHRCVPRNPKLQCRAPVGSQPRIPSVAASSLVNVDWQQPSSMASMHCTAACQLLLLPVTRHPDLQPTKRTHHKHSVQLSVLFLSAADGEECVWCWVYAVPVRLPACTLLEQRRLGEYNSLPCCCCRWWS